MFPAFLPLKASLRAFLRTYATYGRVMDRDVYGDKPLAENPDPIDELSTGDRYFQISLNPFVKSGLKFLDISNLFVSARGLEPDENGSYFPPQLIYTQKEGQNEEQLTALANQFDEDFDGGFQAILKSLHQPAIIYGRAIGEIDWQKDDNGKIGARFIWSRDPEEYLIDPPDFPSGIYKKRHTTSSAQSGDIDRMPDGKFLHISFDPLFNNPYGTSLLRPIAKMTESWSEFYDAWRKAVKNAGYGVWTGKYGPVMRGQDATKLTLREQYRDELKKLTSGFVGVFDQDTEIKAETLNIQEKALLDFHTAYVETVSVLMTGNATALKEGKYGTYADAESTGAREKSKNEQLHALLMGMAFTTQFNPVFLYRNFAQVQLIPQLQLIRPELITPTTPEGQISQDEQQAPRETIDVQERPSEPIAEFAEGEDGADPEAYFDKTREPEIYFDVMDQAKAYLSKMPVKNYKDVTPDEAAGTFTVKRLRSYEDAVPLQKLMLGAIRDTLDIESESQAWNAYWQKVQNIFKERGQDVHRPSSDLLISFRQARQNAFQAGIDNLMEQNFSRLYGVRVETREDSQVRGEHKIWHDVVLRPGDPRLKKLAAPMDFGCRCNQVPVWTDEREQYPLTPENEIPETFPGQTYKYYVMPPGSAEETD